MSERAALRSGADMNSAPRVHFHRWSKWDTGTGEYEAGPLGRKLGLPLTWTQPIQARQCGKCGKIQVKKIGG